VEKKYGIPPNLSIRNVSVNQITWCLKLLSLGNKICICSFRTSCWQPEKLTTGFYRNIRTVMAIGKNMLTTKSGRVQPRIVNR
jgi:hypothetical protein